MHRRTNRGSCINAVDISNHTLKTLETKYDGGNQPCKLRILNSQGINVPQQITPAMCIRFPSVSLRRRNLEAILMRTTTVWSLRYNA